MMRKRIRVNAGNRNFRRKPCDAICSHALIHPKPYYAADHIYKKPQQNI